MKDVKMPYEASEIVVETFEQSTYCNVALPDAGFRISCRKLPRGAALCVAWKKLDDRDTPVPSEEMKRCAEAYAQIEFRKIRRDHEVRDAG